MIDLTAHPVGYLSLALFALAYLAVMAEEFTHLRKSKPVLLAAGLIWVMIAWVGSSRGLSDAVNAAVRHNILEFAELFLFLLVAMTYINALDERRVFEALRSRLVSLGFSYRRIFWLTGVIAFFVSPVADNLTTALFMGAVITTIGRTEPRFVLLGCINLVVAANAGGAFSPFGDITTLMVWQKGIVDFWSFFALFLPALANWLVPAAIMSFSVPAGAPAAAEEQVGMKRGAVIIMALFLLTIACAVLFHQILHLPPATGMMMGLAFLKFFGYYLQQTHNRHADPAVPYDPVKAEEQLGDHLLQKSTPYDVFQRIARAEWDTLFFFYGVILCVGGLGFIGYLALLSNWIYAGLGASTANILVGLLSAVVDNIPVMFAVLTMRPEMSQGQWLLVTLTAGVGGSLLSIGSAAGVGLMGQARGQYTFVGHLKWAPVIALGYAASIAVHFLVNAGRF
ncbi:MAG: sodium:proton antiporter NhaD [Candidatus Methylomirabilia bacterium]